MSKRLGDVIRVGTNNMELIEFKVKKKSPLGESYDCIYGINVFKVREVITMPEVVPLPEEVPYVVGMFSLRNENIPLLNLIERLNGDKEETKYFVIVAEFNNIFIGLLVHEVVQIHRISWEEILPPPKVSGRDEAGLIIGIVKLRDRESLVILDFEKIVSEINPMQQHQVDSYEAEEQQIKEHEGINVLIADDSRTVLKQMKHILIKEGYNVIDVLNGKLAWEELLKAAQIAEDENKNIRKIFGIIITDIEMPMMDGYTLTRNIKEHSVLSEIPVIMHTSLSGGNVQLKGKEVGCDGYITKFNVETFTKTIRNILEKFPMPS
jgi:two-component system, chemotaxis family, chemotaxis protein CheV